MAMTALDNDSFFLFQERAAIQSNSDKKDLTILVIKSRPYINAAARTS